MSKKGDTFAATFLVIGGQSTSVKCACGSDVFVSYGGDASNETDEEHDKRVWTCQDCGALRPEEFLS